MGYLYKPKHPPKGVGYADAKATGRLTESAVWWVKYYVSGRMVRESTGTEHQTEAKRFLKDREGRVAQGAPILPRVDRIKYDEAAKDLRAHYATTGARNLVEAECRLKHLDAYFTGWRLVNITPDTITRYVGQRQEAGASNGTIRREGGVLSKMLRLAYRNGKLLRLPIFDLPEEASPRSGFFESAQYEAVWRHLPVDLRVACDIAQTFGWRMQSEVLTLELRQIDLDGDPNGATIRLDPGTTKNDDGRVVYMPATLELTIREQIARVQKLARDLKRDVPYLFPHLNGRHTGQRVHDFRKRWQTALFKAELDGLDGEARQTRQQELRELLKLPARELRAHPRAGLLAKLRHDFRRTAVRNAVNAGVPERVAMKLTGHRTRSVFDRYHIVSPADLKDAARKIGQGAAQNGVVPRERPIEVGPAPRA